MERRSFDREFREAMSRKLSILKRGKVSVGYSQAEPVTGSRIGHRVRKRGTQHRKTAPPKRTSLTGLRISSICLTQSASIMEVASLMLQSTDCGMRSEGHGWNRTEGAHRDRNPPDYLDPVEAA